MFWVFFEKLYHVLFFFFFFFNDTATTEIYTVSDTLSLHDALPIPGSPSTVTAHNRPEASRISLAIASSSELRPMTSPDARRSWTASEHCGPTSGSRASPAPARSGWASVTEAGSLTMWRDYH